jgi:hypothetical protein
VITKKQESYTHSWILIWFYKEARLTDTETQMIHSLMIQYLQLEIKIEELEFKINLKGK